MDLQVVDVGEDPESTIINKKSSPGKAKDDFI